MAPGLMCPLMRVVIRLFYYRNQPRVTYGFYTLAEAKDWLLSSMIKPDYLHLLTLIIAGR